MTGFDDTFQPASADSDFDSASADAISSPATYSECVDTYRGVVVTKGYLADDA